MRACGEGAEGGERRGVLRRAERKGGSVWKERRGNARERWEEWRDERERMSGREGERKGGGTQWGKIEMEEEIGRVREGAREGSAGQTASAQSLSRHQFTHLCLPVPPAGCCKYDRTQRG